MNVEFSMATSDPKEVVTTVREEISRRLTSVKSRVPARTQRETARLGGEISALEGVIWFLDRITITAPQK